MDHRRRPGDEASFSKNPGSAPHGLSRVLKRLSLPTIPLSPPAPQINNYNHQRPELQPSHHSNPNSRVVSRTPFHKRKRPTQKQKDALIGAMEEMLECSQAGLAQAQANLAGIEAERGPQKEQYPRYRDMVEVMEERGGMGKSDRRRSSVSRRSAFPLW